MKRFSWCAFVATLVAIALVAGKSDAARRKKSKRAAPAAEEKVGDDRKAKAEIERKADPEPEPEAKPEAKPEPEITLAVSERKSEAASEAEPETDAKAEAAPGTPAPPASSGAPPAAFSGNSSASALWHTDNHDTLTDNDNYGFALVRHNAMIDAGDTRMSLRIDHEHVVNNPRRPDGSYPDRRTSIRLERVALEISRTWAPVAVQITAGDFYAQLGRGLVLTLRKYDELGLDFAMRGGRVQLGLFEDIVTGTAMAGFANINNIIPETEEFLGDPRDRLGAAALEARPTSWLMLGAQGALVTGGDLLDDDGNGTPDRREDNRVLNTSGSTEITVGPWVVGAEYARQTRRFDLEPTARGSALFATFTGPVGPVTLLGEFKDYRQYLTLNALSGPERSQVLYSAAPTAERIDQEVVDNTDVTGGRLRADLTVGANVDLALHASLGLFKYRFDRLNVMHGYGGVKRQLASGGAFAVIGGYRRGTEFSTGTLSLSHFQFEADLLLPLTSHLSMHANVKPERVMKDGSGPYMRGTSLVELDWLAKLSVGAGLDWTKESAAMMALNPLPTFYPFGIVRVRPNDTLLVQLFGGSQKGGLKCFAGVCRIVPPFAGVRLDVTVRF